MRMKINNNYKIFNLDNFPISGGIFPDNLFQDNALNKRRKLNK